MATFKLSPGRIGWIILLGLLAFISQRVAERPPEPRRVSAEIELPSQTSIPQQRAGQASKSSATALKRDQDLFSLGKFPRLRIELSRSEMSKLRNYHWQWGGDNGQRQDAKATVYEGDMVFTNVSIHLKGSAGSFRPVDQKASFTLNFDKLAPGQRFYGLKKIHLNNSVQDPSYLSEQISRELFLAAGVPTTRATHAKVELNGRDLGVYVLVEGWNKQFLKRHFEDNDGVLYDGGFAKEVSFPLAVMTGDASTDRADLQALVAAAKEPASRRLAALDKVLDVDRFLSFIAMEVLLAHWDGYAMNRNNYRIYHDPQSDKLVFMPHGMDQMFGSWSSKPDSPITPQMKGLVARAVVQTPDGRARYLDRLGQLYTNVYRTDVILKRIDELSARVRPLVSEGSLWATPGHAQGVGWLRQRISQRGKSIQQQLAMRGTPLDFGGAREIKLRVWQQQSGRGNASYGEARSPEGHRLLKINLQGNGYGSWRTKVLLEPGEYQFIGKVRAENLRVPPNDPRAGVGLRISGDQFAERLLQDADWTVLSFEFDVPGIADVELVCECRALQGEATFDVDSLRLVRK